MIEIVTDELSSYAELDEDQVREIAGAIGDRMVEECSDVYDDSSVIGRDESALDEDEG